MQKGTKAKKENFANTTMGMFSALSRGAQSKTHRLHTDEGFFCFRYYVAGHYYAERE